MVYSGGFAIGISNNGEFLEERKDGRVTIPYDSEYVIRLRNENSRRAVCKIFLDGENVSDGGYIIPSHDFIDIERYSNTAKRFKFVDLNSEEAILNGKSGPNIDGSKGLIECHFWLERQQNYYVSNVVRKWNTGYPQEKTIYKPCQFTTNNTLANNEGVTVQGGISTQQFTSGYINLDYTNCIVLKLILTGGQPQHKAIYCMDCGCKSPKNKAKFCYSCGYQLV